MQIDGIVYNSGGTVWVLAGSLLNITRFDANNRSYWQNNATALLRVDADSNLQVAGNVQIDQGTVRLVAPSGGSATALTGQGFLFGNAQLQFWEHWYDQNQCGRYPREQHQNNAELPWR